VIRSLRTRLFLGLAALLVVTCVGAGFWALDWSFDVDAGLGRQLSLNVILKCQCAHLQQYRVLKFDGLRGSDDNHKRHS
jgi:hypothetical protein